MQKINNFIIQYATINNMRYLLRAISLTGRVEDFIFDNKADALNKVRELKDMGGYIVKPILELPAEEYA